MGPLFSSLICVILFIGPILPVCSVFTASFSPNNLTIHMHTSEKVNLTLEGLPILSSGSYLQIVSDNPRLAEVSKKILPSEIQSNGHWAGDFDVNGLFLGTSNVYVELVKFDNTTEIGETSLPLIIIREYRPIDQVFTISVALLVSLLYINFGAALDLTKMKEIIIKPVGPAIGFCGQFIAMPLIAFGLGSLLFPDDADMQLGIFFTGCSPGGGGSNIWTVFLGGNLDLSVTMTSISTFAAFAMMPLWIFTLGKVIFDKGELRVPYSKLATYIVALVIPLGIGLLIQRFFPRVRNILVRLLKPLSSILILFIIIFAIVTNLYLFELFSWQIILAGLGLPWFGYIIGYLVAGIFDQNHKDRLAIAIETGIQNTGISIFLLRFSLPQPQADLTTVVPVSVAIMTPVPLLCIYIIQKIRRWMADKNQPTLLDERGDSGVSS